MKKSRFSEEQIITILKQHEAGVPNEAGVPTSQLCREHGISLATFYSWKAKFGGMNVSETQRLRELEQENTKLKRIVADQALDIVALKDVLTKNGEARLEEACGGLSANTAWSVTTACRFLGETADLHFTLSVKTPR